MELDWIAESAEGGSRVFRKALKDRTGLEGLYPTDPPEFVTTVREQLGLKLDVARGPLNVLVILGAEQPSFDE